MANADDDDILDAGLFVNTGYTLHDFCIQDFAFKLKVLDAATSSQYRHFDFFIFFWWMNNNNRFSVHPADYDLTGQVRNAHTCI
jgi:hypothetical protein